MIMEMEEIKIEIIKHGKYFKDNKITCSNCKCKFIYSKEDIQKIIWEFVVCPECERKIYLN